MLPTPERVRHETSAAILTVARVETLAPKDGACCVAGKELEGFTSACFDDHVKLFFSSDEEGRTDSPQQWRDFTPALVLMLRLATVDRFFLHEAGPPLDGLTSRGGSSR